MPELPDITIYLEALDKRILGHLLQCVQIGSPFLLRTAAPPIGAVEGKRVLELRRLGKRICIRVEDDLWLVLHLMIAGRLHWKDAVGVSRKGRGSGALSQSSARTPLKRKNTLAVFNFDNGQLSLTEAGTQRRASLHVVRDESALQTLSRGGVEVLDVSFAEFRNVLRSENHTLKRALTDPRLFSGIGNAYSDEILWDAQLSPVKLTQKMSDEEIARLHRATRETLELWIERLREETGDGFPERVTAFRDGMAVHGRYREPCPRCGAKVQRIRYATNETNYCPTCQTRGKLLADRALSRLLREDWPRTAEELA
ncbi:MAG TPA: DNA-formamidopyrimidine glycosylase family protein [Pyrinomonadaceae bacterium]|jgi:formamidopyrimidine-DNA glycosylase|nr:DNA-formamidopyrimidine glycosylase family protein [Pyrinomonadaceae bacterium]